MALNGMMFGIGLSIGFPTIVIPALRGLQPDKYMNETIRFSPNESSWFGKFYLWVKPLYALKFKEKKY